MTVCHRPTLLLAFAVVLGPLPACLHVSGTVTSDENRTKDDKTQFAIDRPGMKVPIHPTAVEPITDNQPTPNTQTTSQRPTTELAPATEPIAPLPPDGVQPTRAIEPNPLPIIAAPAPSQDSPLLAAVRASIENRPNDALKHLKELDKPGQEFALAVIPLLLRGAQINPETADPNDVAVLAEQFHAIANRLEPNAALRIDKIAFCRSISGFGRYQPWPEAQPYRPRDLSDLYVEVRHVTAEAAAGPHGEAFVTRLVSTLEVRDANGQLVEQTDPDDCRRSVGVAKFERTDFSRTPPRDYFLKYRFPVPSAPGVYTVVVTVKDPVGQRSVRSKPAEFRVAGP